MWILQLCVLLRFRWSTVCTYVPLPGISDTVSVRVCRCVDAYVFLSACQYDMVGPEGIVESHQITRDGKADTAEAVDCKWYIRAPPRSKVSDISSAPIQL